MHALMPYELQTSGTVRFYYLPLFRQPNISSGLAQYLLLLLSTPLGLSISADAVAILISGNDRKVTVSLIAGEK